MSVFISYENKKLRLKVTAATLVSSLVTEAKERWKLEGDTACYMLKNPRTKAVVDLAQPFRLTGLQPQCTLEMVLRDSSHGVKIEPMKPSSIRVGLKYSGKLQEGKFSPDETLLTVVKVVFPELLESQAPPMHLRFMHILVPSTDLERVTLRSIGVSSGPVCFHVEAQEADGESKDALMGGNQSTDPDVPTPLDSILKNDVVQANTTKIEQSPAHVSHPVGLNGCKSALHAMKKYNFDEDSRKCILTLIKYVDNVIHRPNDASTRSISIMNSAFHSRVSSVRGGMEFLLALGFEEQVAATNPISSSSTSDRDTQASRRMLVLSPCHENSTLLSTARRLLASEALEIGVKRSDLPHPPKQQTVKPEQRSFDPYQPLVTSIDAQPSADERGESITDTQLKNLKALKNTIQDRSIERNVTVLLPRVTAHSNAENTFGNVPEDVKCDTQIIAERVAKQQAERKRLDKTPFRTKAMREVQHLRSTQVYSTAIIRVQFPNRIQLQASFRSTELVSAIYEVVHESLAENYRVTPYHLYITPPKRKLSASALLTDEGLVPAAIVYINWDDKKQHPGPSDDFLQPDLLRKATELGKPDELYPQGIRLDHPPASAVVGGGASGGPTVECRTAAECQGKSQSSSQRKLGWLKI